MPTRDQHIRASIVIAVLLMAVYFSCAPTRDIARWRCGGYSERPAGCR